MISILVGGDVCPMGIVERAFVEGKGPEIFGDLLEEINGADLSLANLECPLVSKQTPIEKAGPTLGADVSCANGLVATGWDVLSLANNHSYDHGAPGLAETIGTIRQTGMSVVGAGLDIMEAQEPFVTVIRGRRVAICAMAEQEFSVADQNMGGANPLDLIRFVNCIRQHKQNGVFIVLLHGGQEHYPYPSPEMVRRCRFMIEMGADAVVCCHAHCPLPWEIYAGRPIVYGLGNLVFEAAKMMDKSWYEGYLAKLLISETDICLRVVPYHQSLVCLGARRMGESEQGRFLDEMRQKCSILKNSEFLDSRWREYCRRERENYLVGLFGYNRLMRKVGHVLLSRIHSRREVLRALHLVQCETHREVLGTIFRDEMQRGAR